MADTHDLFQDFLDEIRLDLEKRGDLKTSRDANRARIEKYFTETLNRPKPVFRAQGSYPMHSGVNPIDGNCDIDDGVYIQGLGTDPTKWPTPETVHGWLVAAVKDATSSSPIDKARCVRVPYASSYHIDLPSYVEDEYGKPLLFEKGKAPYESDPKALTDWFTAIATEEPQVRRLVRYLKAWKDFKSAISSTASGLALTILCVQHYIADERDDVALVETVRAMHTFLQSGGRVAKPVTPFDDLSSKWSDTQRATLIDKLNTLHERGQDALDTEDREKAAGIWRRQFGDRFPLPDPDENKNEQPRRTSAPAVIVRDARSA